MRQVAGDGVNGIKAGSGTGVGWSRTGEGDATTRVGDKTSVGKMNAETLISVLAME